MTELGEGTGVVSDFDEFVRARSARLLRTAYLLTQDHALAEDLLQTALARSWPVWRRLDGDPEPYVRKVLVNTYNSWWRRRWNAERPAVELPEPESPAPQANVDDRDEVWRALQRLPRQQRAVLVLRYFEDLSEAQIAEVMSISTGSVKHYASKGLAKLRLDPSLLTVSVDAPLGTERVTAVHDRIRTRRRARVAAVSAVVIAAITATLLLIPRQDRRPEPITPSPSPSATLAEYFGGFGNTATKVVAKLPWTEVSQGSASFTWIPSSLSPISPLGDCLLEGVDNPAAFRVSVKITGSGGLNLFPEATQECRSSSPGSPRGYTTEGIRIPATVSEPIENLYGFEVGKPVTVTIEFQRPSGDSASLPPSGNFAVAIGQQVPFEEFPIRIPSRKPERESPRPLGPDVVGRITASGPSTATVPWRDGLTFSAHAQAPGQLWFSINGVRTPGLVITFWDYNDWYTIKSAQLSWPLDVPEPPVGTPVTVTVEARMALDTWYVDIER